MEPSSMESTSMEDPMVMADFFSVKIKTASSSLENGKMGSLEAAEGLTSMIVGIESTVNGLKEGSSLLTKNTPPSRIETN
jgi:hypothetical protein